MMLVVSNIPGLPPITPNTSLVTQMHPRATPPKIEAMGTSRRTSILRASSVFRSIVAKIICVGPSKSLIIFSGFSSQFSSLIAHREKSAKVKRTYVLQTKVRSRSAESVLQVGGVSQDRAQRQV